MTAARPTATGAPGYTETMPCERESARRARLLVAAVLDAWGIGELAGDGVQVVAELVNNAVRHTRCRVVQVRVTRPAEGVVRIGVADNCRDTPEPGDPDDDSEGGRGLLLVEALSWRWGYDRKRRGKVVWAELKVPGAEAPVAR
ncbi:ATP-binding protein [Streptomyces griseoviridis]|uniref:ATP-binding protein n=2 Tax=Streptomyces griseoviridis TaxID=45398 RepID=A0A3S9ZG13_STRGD|nr:ATP-binding protein [Streptomyces griseoviridis]AZS86696.1 ATP-binding protein [Streptomyces griseoviridis]QCN90614.1 ATP-binding protein [Streptomyces griseoviridis]